MFTDPQVILFVADCERAARFYGAFGLVETFRGGGDPPVKIEMLLGGFSLGLALPGPAAERTGSSRSRRGIAPSSPLD